MPLSSAATTLIIGVPSLAIAAATYLFARQAHAQQLRATANKVDADAIMRAKEVYESAIGTLRTEIADMRAELTRVRAELADVQADNRRLESQIAALRAGGRG